MSFFKNLFEPPILVTIPRFSRGYDVLVKLTKLEDILLELPDIDDITLNQILSRIKGIKSMIDKKTSIISSPMALVNALVPWLQIGKKYFEKWENKIDYLIDLANATSFFSVKLGNTISGELNNIYYEVRNKLP